MAGERVSLDLDQLKSIMEGLALADHLGDTNEELERLALACGYRLEWNDEMNAYDLPWRPTWSEEDE
jgi:hypothetical protein